MLARTAATLAEADVVIQAVHQSMRQVDMQFVLEEKDYESAVRALHSELVEAHNHGRAIKLATPEQNLQQD